MRFNTIVTKAGEFELAQLATVDAVRPEDVAKYGEEWAMETLKKQHAYALATEILAQGLGEQSVEYDIRKDEHQISTTIWIATRR